MKYATWLIVKRERFINDNQWIVTNHHTWNDNKSYLAARLKRLLIVWPQIKRAPIGFIVVIRVNCINISMTCLNLAKYRENISRCDIVNDKSDEHHDSCEAYYHIEYVCFAKVGMQLEYIYYSHQFMTMMNYATKPKRNNMLLSR